MTNSMTDSLNSLNALTKMGIDLTDFYTVSVDDTQCNFQGDFASRKVKSMRKLGIIFQLMDSGYIEGKFDSENPLEIEINGEDVPHLERVRIVLT